MSSDSSNEQTSPQGSRWLSWLLDIATFAGVVIAARHFLSVVLRATPRIGVRGGAMFSFHGAGAHLLFHMGRREPFHLNGLYVQPESQKNAGRAVVDFTARKWNDGPP